MIDSGNYQDVIVSTGVLPRDIDIPGINHPSVLSYPEALQQKKIVGERVAIIGAGGIGFDMATFLLGEGEIGLDQWYRQWGIDPTLQARGALIEPRLSPPERQITLLQRKTTKPGKSLGKTTGWAHKLHLQKHNVDMLTAVNYELIDDRGLHIRVDGKPRILEVDNVIICAGQVSNNIAGLIERGANTTLHIIGGADFASELDAKRAILQGTELAVSL